MGPQDRGLPNLSNFTYAVAPGLDRLYQRLWSVDPPDIFHIYDERWKITQAHIQLEIDAISLQIQKLQADLAAIQNLRNTLKR